MATKEQQPLEEVFQSKKRPGSPDTPYVLEGPPPKRVAHPRDERSPTPTRKGTHTYPSPPSSTSKLKQQELVRELTVEGTSSGEDTPNATDSPLSTVENSPLEKEVVDAVEAGDDGGLGVLKFGMKEMVEFINHLRALGIEGLMTLPRIAVVGNQSAGKSSLIEAISGIKVPRYSGTCTRCPLEINLTDSEDPSIPWHCKISLRFNKEYQPQRADNGRDPWLPRAQIEQHPLFEISSKDQVQDALIVAQSAILNPSRDWKVYKRDVGSPELLAAAASRVKKEEFEVKFSPNVVCMEITGHDLPNLAFIDLPGVIQTTESDKEDYLIKLVSGLVKEYVKGEDCLVLLAMTMKDDAVNQSAVRLTRELGGDRVIGTLTKPDTVLKGEFSQWIDIIRGKSHKLKHGYFVTKQPSQHQLDQGITHQMARQEEEEFFKSNEPWNTELADFQERFGTAKLQSYLALQLGGLIRKRLPSIVDKVERQAEVIVEELKLYPAPPSDRENHLMLISNLLSAFCAEVEGKLTGKIDTIFLNEFHGLVKELRSNIDGTRPTISFSASNERQGMSINRNGPVTSQTGRTVTPAVNGASNLPYPTRYSIQEIREILSRTSSAGIPDEIDYKAKYPLIRMSLENWGPHINTYMTKCQRLLQTECLAIFSRQFAAYSRSPLHATVTVALTNYVNEMLQRLASNLQVLFELEAFAQPSTLNDSEFVNHRDIYHERLATRRKSFLEEQGNTPRRGNNRARDEQRGLDAADPVKQEVKVMAIVQGYYEIASRRFIDYVNLHARHNVEVCIPRSMRDALEERIGLRGPDANEKARELLIEDPAREARRKELLTQQKQLVKALDEVRHMLTLPLRA